MKKIIICGIVLLAGTLQLPAFCQLNINTWSDLKQQVEEGGSDSMLQSSVNIIAPSGAGPIDNPSKNKSTSLCFGTGYVTQIIQGDTVNNVFTNEGSMEISGTGPTYSFINSYDTSINGNIPTVAAIQNNGDLLLEWMTVNGGVSQSSSSAALGVYDTASLTLTGATNSITGGTIKFFTPTGLPAGGNLLNIAGGYVTNGVNIQLTLGNTLQVSGTGNVTVDGADNYEEGTLNVTGGTLNLDGVTLLTKASGGAVFTQTDGTTNLNNQSNVNIASANSTFTGGTVTINDGSTLTFSNGLTTNAVAVTMASTASAPQNTLNILPTSSGTPTTLTLNSGTSITGGILNIGTQRSTVYGNVLNVASGATIAQGAQVNFYSPGSWNDNLNIIGGNVTLDAADIWGGIIDLSSGTLTLNNMVGSQTNDIYSQTGGTLNLTNGTTFYVQDYNVNPTITTNGSGSGTTTINIGTATGRDESSLILNWAGTTLATAAAGDELIVNVGSSTSFGNSFNITGGTLDSSATLNLHAGNSMNLSSGTATLNGTGSGIDTWSGNVNVTGGTLNLNSITSNGAYNQTGGTTNLSAGSILTLLDNSNLGGGKLNLAQGTLADNPATVNLSNTSAQTVATQFNGAGIINKNAAGNSTFTADNSGFTGTYNQSAGAATIQNNFFTGTNNLTGGTVNIASGGNLTLNAGDTWTGTNISTTGGTLNLDGLYGIQGFSHTTGGTYNQTGGTLNLTRTSSLTLGASSNITTNGSGTGISNVNIGTLTGTENSSLTLGTGSSMGTAANGDTLTVNVGSATSTGNSLNVTGGTLAQSAVINLNANNSLNISDGTAYLNEAGTGIDTLAGNISLSGGDLYADSITSYGSFTQTGGNLYIENGLTGTSPALGEHHFHGGNITLRNNGNLILKSPDTWTTTNFNVAGGTLTMDNFSHNATSSSGTINQTSGTTRLINGSNLIIGDNSHFTGGNLFIDSASNLDITTNGTTFGASLSGSGAIVKYGTGTLLLSGQNSAFDGAMVINAGNVNYSNAESFMSGVTRLSGGNLGLTYGANAEMGTDIELSDNSTLTINTNGYNVLSGTDCITSTAGHGNTLIKDGNGNLTFDARTNPNINYNLQVNQGTMSLVSNNLNFNDNVTVGQGPGNPVASLNINSPTTTFNNDLTLSNAYMALTQGGFNVNRDMSVGSTINTMNGMIAANNIGRNFNIGDSGSANFLIDVSPSTGTSDTYFVNGDVTTSHPGGVINISAINLIGPVTANKNINLNVFGASATSTVDSTIVFSATNNLFTSPYAKYALSSQGNGAFALNFVDYNPQVFRGQVATEAAYANQLTTNNVIFDHIGLVTQQLLSSEKPNVYANENPLFAPYQYDKQGGNLWYKAYGNLERLQLSQNINTQNNMWGSLIGADFPLVSLKNGWKLLPTAYVGYTGAYQTYNGVDMYQNGGQAGVMGTFYKGNFIESLLANVGGYGNDMNVNGTRDVTGNWFAGVASKSAYNISLPKDFILQPNFLISYNAFGNQNWSSNYGNTSMLTNMLNGLNVAPGLNLILNKETWSVYATTQLMFNVMNGCSGSINDINLPSVKMGSTYFSYGLGFTKRFKDRLSVYGQVLFSNGVRTGVGFQGGLQWKF